MLRMFVESRQKLQQRTGCRPLWDTLFPIYWVPWQFSVWPVCSICVRPSLGLALGLCDLFHILYDVHTSVYSRVLPSSPWTFFESFPLFFFFILFRISLGLPSLAGWCCLHLNVCVVVFFFFHTKCTVVYQIMFSWYLLSFQRLWLYHFNQTFVFLFSFFFACTCCCVIWYSYFVILFYKRFEI